MSERRSRWRVARFFVHADYENLRDLALEAQRLLPPPGGYLKKARIARLRAILDEVELMAATGLGPP